MHRTSWVPMAAFAAVLALHANSAIWSQDSDRSERYFDELDRNDDGYLDSDEFRRLDGRMRDRFRDRGVDGDRPVSKSRFMDTYRRIDEDRKKEEEERRRDGDKNSSSSSSSDRDRGSSSRSRRTKIKLTASLPAKFVAFDLNKDDQIGMYEWDRSKYAEFVALDRNGDGFLTPNELDDPPKPNATAVTATASTGGPSPSRSAAPVATSPAAPTTNDDPDTKMAKYFFSLADKDKNGELSADEWTAARGTRSMFEKAGITAAVPLKDTVFIQHYLAVKQKK